MATRNSPPPTPPYVSPGRKTPSPQPEASRSRRSPSPDTCPICLDILDEGKDRSFSDNCAHAFCFICLLEWSKNKRECPLCKKPFTAIIHGYKSHNDYQLHKLPPPAPVFPATGGSAEMMQRMSQLRRMFLLHTQQTQNQAQAPFYRRSAMTQRNERLRPATTDYRRFIYSYGLYCEGANPPNGSHRFRRVTPDFYRQNPAVMHRLVPWLNRELVAILPHRNNTQYVLDHILREIKRVDLRSNEFRRSIQPYILSNTDHFIHEFHQFAMSPLNVAEFDTYARYPAQPRGIRNRPHPEVPNVAAMGSGRANVTRPPSSSSSSSSSEDSDIEVRETRPSAVTGTSLLPSRDRSHRDSQGSNTLRSTTPYHRRTRWDTSTSTPSEYSRLNYNQRTNVNRLERSLMAIDGTSGNVTYFHPAPSIVSTETDSYSRLVNRVRNLLEDSEPSASTSSPSQVLDMPLLSDLTGETRPSQRRDTPTQSSDLPTRSGPNNLPTQEIADSRQPATVTDWSDVYQARSSAPARRTSIASSHSSDVILVKEEKPYRERTPIELTESSSEDELIKPQIFKASLTTPVRSLSSSSDSSSDRPDTSKATNQHTRFKSPDLSEQSDQSDSDQLSSVESNSDGQSAPYREAGMISTNDSNNKGQQVLLKSDPKTKERTNHATSEAGESSDSDCMVLFQATKVGSSRKRKSEPTKEKPHKEKRAKRKDNVEKKGKSGKECKHKRSERKSSPVRESTTMAKDRPKHKHDKTKQYHSHNSTKSKHESSHSYRDVDRNSLINDTEGGSSKQCNLDIVIESPSDHAASVKITMESTSKASVAAELEGSSIGDTETGATASGLSSNPEDSGFYLDYSRDEVSHKEPAKKRRGYKDIREQLRYFAKTKLTEKYLGHEKKYKKHNKGHKHS